MPRRAQVRDRIWSGVFGARGECPSQTLGLMQGTLRNAVAVVAGGLWELGFEPEAIVCVCRVSACAVAATLPSPEHREVAQTKIDAARTVAEYHGYELVLVERDDGAPTARLA
jgi:hypothetical protein